MKGEDELIVEVTVMFEEDVDVLDGDSVIVEVSVGVDVEVDEEVFVSLIKDSTVFVIEYELE